MTVHHCAAAAAPASKVDAVQAEFAQAGLSVEVINQILKSYKPYISWDVESRLRPMIQLWLQELGNDQLSTRLQQQPHLLVHTPSEYGQVHLWLSSLDVDADRIQRKFPGVMIRELDAVQATVSALQHATQLTDAELPAFLYIHHRALLYSPERVLEIVQATATVLDLSPGSAKFREVLLTLGNRLFMIKPSYIVPRVTYFCEQYGVGGSTAQAALRQNLPSVSETTMQLRAADLQVTLGCDDLQLRKVLSAQPGLLTRQSFTMAVNMKDLQGLGFSAAQAFNMCTSSPSLMTRKWTSAICAEKVQFLTLLLGLTLDNVAARSVLLTLSVAKRLGPRVWFLFQSGVLDTPKCVLSSGHLSNVCSRTNADFSQIYSMPLSRPPMIYDTAYIKQWQQRWQFLTHNMKLSVKDIAAEDYLTAIATLSDQEYAQVFEYNV